MKCSQMSALDELMKNLMERANIKKSRKRPRDTVYTEDKSYIICRNTKTRQESSDIASPILEEKCLKLEEKN